MMNSQFNRNGPGPDPTERFVDGFGQQVFNRDLLCARCVHLMEDAVAECQIYEQKPLPVLRGGDSCPDFVPRDRAD